MTTTATIDHGIFNNSYYNVFNETVDPALNVESLLKQEESRLLSKKKVIDPLYRTKLRQDSQVRSMTQRKNAYNYIVLVTAVAIAVVMSLFIIKNNFPLLPEWIMNILLMLTTSGSIIYILILYADILKRDKTDFDKVDFGLLIEVDKVKESESADSGAVLGTDDDDESNNLGKECEGGQCCPEGSYFWGNRCNKTESFSNRRSSSIQPFYERPSFTSV